MKIGSRDIGAGHAHYVIAEIGVNHDGEVSRALELTDAAADAGADAVKLQYFETDRLMSKAAKLAAYQRAAGETDPVEMLRRLELTLDEMKLVVDRAHARGIHAIVTVFSVELVKPAARLAWDAFKSASPDVVNRPLLDALAAAGLPLIVSTGASDSAEIERARGWLDGCADRLAFLHCVSSYPTDPADANFGAVAHVGDLVHPCAHGYSDHTVLEHGGRAAAHFGARILEKHLTDDPTRAGPDHRASLAPAAFARYVEETRSIADRPGADHLDGIEAAWTKPGKKVVLDCERDVREVSRQSVVATRALAPGETVERSDLTTKRPGTGIEPWRINELVGRRAARAIEADVPIVGDDLGIAAMPDAHAAG